MNNRENFETLFLILYKKWREWEKQTCAYGVGWDIWQEQQKIIDDLQLKLAIKDDMITALNLTIDTLKAENPDVPCPVCEGKRGHAEQKRYPEDNSGIVNFDGSPSMEWVQCVTCKGKGTVPLTKAQEYRIRELQAEIERLDK